jgi:solute carrier family 25 phosphate transporter 23/24/25/41
MAAATAAATMGARVEPGVGAEFERVESEEEREVRIRGLFDSFDSSKVGYLESAQIESGLQSLSFPFQKKYAVEMVEACDANHDGRIDYPEFRRYMDAKELELLKLFEAIDVSQDGALQPEELYQALQNSGVQLGEQELDAFVQYIDRDKNGKITFGEWRDFLLLYPREATLPSIYQYWEKVSLVDIGEQAVIPEGIGEHHQLRYLVAGAMAGAVSRTATAPLDRLKVMLAVQTHTTTATGIMHGLKHIYKQNGVAGFFRGNGLNVLKISPESAIKFYAYEIMKRVVVGDGKHGEIGTSGRLVAGGAAGAIAQALIYPIDLVKTRLQCYSEPGRAPPLAKFTRDIVVNEGPRALFRGLLPSLLGIIPYAGIDLATYETLKIKSRQFLPPDTEPGPFLHLACGTFSGALGATCVYPLQLIRTRLQAQALTSVDRYTSMTDAFRRTYRHEGMRGFYKGWLPNMLKVVPSASITYLVYEDMKIRLSLK